MAHYAIGDIQGCFDEFTLLLDKINFNHGTDTLWLVGDIVNRGPKSLEVLQFCMEHESSVRMVLGNHDLHLLAVGCGEGTVKRSDTITPILTHTDSKKMLDWLRSNPCSSKASAMLWFTLAFCPNGPSPAPNCSPAKPKPSCAAKNTKSFSPKCTATNPPNGAKT